LENGGKDPHRAPPKKGGPCRGKTIPLLS